MDLDEKKAKLLDSLTEQQKEVVRSEKRRVLVIAGAGSGKTEVMARRVAWWVGVNGVRRDAIVAFTFTERAAEEMKFRIREKIQRITPAGEDVTLGGMYVGTIHGFCLKLLREVKAATYHNYDILEDTARVALLERGFHNLLGLNSFQSGLSVSRKTGKYETIDRFIEAYDLLNEYGELDVKMPPGKIPYRLGPDESDWCKKAELATNVGTSAAAQAFAVSAARYYAYLRCRRFLDFSTSQSELVRVLTEDPKLVNALRDRISHLVIDEAQDINVVQDSLFRLLVGTKGTLTAVGDHRQAIFGWRGARVDIMAKLFAELKKSRDGEVIELQSNFRSTKRIIDIANGWATTIGAVRGMTSPPMDHGRRTRVDYHPSHVAAIKHPSRTDEAAWIADSINKLVRPPTAPSNDGTGASHDTRDGERGISYSDIAVLLRTSTNAREYMQTLTAAGIPAVFRAGPDLFSQPEVLLFTGVLSVAAGMTQFFGAAGNRTGLPARIAETLNCQPDPISVVRAACTTVAADGLPLSPDAADRLVLAGRLIQERITDGIKSRKELKHLKTERLVAWLSRKKELRRVFPQQLLHWLLAEAGVGEWESAGNRGQTAMFHLGQLSTLVKGMETPGWTSTREFPFQIVALCTWSAQKARIDEAPLLVAPNAITITTIHAAKGLEWPVVFVADVIPRRFPNQRARTAPSLPFDGPILRRVDPADLADNANYDGERRLFYVALTRAERYLFVSCSPVARSKNDSEFFVRKSQLAVQYGGLSGTSVAAPTKLRLLPSEFKRELRLSTSFSDLRYYLECPHDFYLRKVLGFAPSIDQAFGYGRGVHNLMREVHSNPKQWAELAKDPPALDAKIAEMIEGGLFYLRYTTGDPAEQMRAKAKRVVAEYIKTYAAELGKLTFDPEREFETLIEEEQVLISGAIDIVRLDDPPRVSIIDFKSGREKSDARAFLDQEEMKLQVSIYALAAKKELEYEPERGFIRYLGEENPTKKEHEIPFTDEALSQARDVVVGAARDIRGRRFNLGPRKNARGSSELRCAECDFSSFCGMKEAKQYRTGGPAPLGEDDGES